ncbi:MAG: YwaF family protein [Oscillospiraceae bacterium]
MTGLDAFLTATAWQMTPPAAYGAFHLCFFFGGIFVSVLLAWRLRGLGERGNRILLFSVGLLLCIFELYKQLFYYYVLYDQHYAWHIFPFHLCSVPMYFCLLAPFLPEGKLRSATYDFMLAFNLMGGFLAFLEPSGLITAHWTLTLHAFAWHMTLVFIGLYLGFSRRAGRRVADFKPAALTFVVLCGIAFCINLIFRDVSGGAINMFFVGPTVSPIIVFNGIAEKFGWYVCTPLYMLSCCVGAFAFYYPFCLMNAHKPATIKRRHVTA